ncbi:MAG: aminotransferase class I/II-fold pyridoxal phosphate-dependent enzyme [Planctomycetia bacterium]|nr:aminotransferase class I/II-fold pyridoxal phosphate-dependent enzyme [Planctomycetia bacterium]
MFPQKENLLFDFPTPQRSNTSESAQESIRVGQNDLFTFLGDSAHEALDTTFQNALDAQADELDRLEFAKLCQYAKSLSNRRFQNNAKASNPSALLAPPAYREYTTLETKDEQSNRSVTPSLVSPYRLESETDAIVTMNGEAYLYFTSDSPLGIQTEPEMVATVCNAALQYGLGTAPSRRAFTSAPIEELEEECAKFYGTSRAYYATSKERMAEAFLRMVHGVFECVFVDEQDAEFWSPIFQRVVADSQFDEPFDKRGFVVFKHFDHDDLGKKLRKNLRGDARALLLTHSVDHVDGAIAPLDLYLQELKNFCEPMMLVDDSLGLGILGAHGRGALEHFGIDFSEVNVTSREMPFGGETFQEHTTNGWLGWIPQSDDFILNANESETSSKKANSSYSEVKLFMFASLVDVVGGDGAIAPGTEPFVARLNELANDSNSIRHSNLLVSAMACGVRLLGTSQERRKRLNANVEYLREGLQKLGLKVNQTPMPIITFQVGTVQRMRRIHQRLTQERILLSFQPGPYRGARGYLRMTVMANHTVEMLNMALESLHDALTSVFE